MIPEIYNYASFFDSDNIREGFEFVKPKPKHTTDLETPPILSAVFSCHGPQSDPYKKARFSLHHNLIVCYAGAEFPDLPDSVLEITLSRLKALIFEEANNEFGFMVTHNNISYEFSCNDRTVIEQWIKALKRYCVSTNFAENYKPLKVVGKGGFAQVFLVESQSEKAQFAAKAFSKEGMLKANKGHAQMIMINEINMMRHLRHENLVRLFEVIETEKSIYIIMEYIKGKPLANLIKKTLFKKPLPEDRILPIMYSLVDALAYMSARKIMHRDLKPANILVTETGKVKIIDFGLATPVYQKKFIFRKCGTPGYIAPEIFTYNPKIAETAYDERCDMFSLGCIFYQMLFKKPVFSNYNPNDLLQINKGFAADFPAFFTIKREIDNNNSKMSKQALYLLLQMLEPEPVRRITANEALREAYFSPITSGFSPTARESPYEQVSPYQQIPKKNQRSQGATASKDDSSNLSQQTSPLHVRFNKGSWNFDVENQPELSHWKLEPSSGELPSPLNQPSTPLNMIKSANSRAMVSSHKKRSSITAPSFNGKPFQRRSLMHQGSQQNFLKAAIINNIKRNSITEGSEEHIRRRSKLGKVQLKLPRISSRLRDDNDDDLSNSSDEDANVNEIGDEHCCVNLKIDNEKKTMKNVYKSPPTSSRLLGRKQLGTYGTHKK